MNTIEFTDDMDELHVHNRSNESINGILLQWMLVVTDNSVLLKKKALQENWWK
jgi:hypothetical protein